MHTFSHKCEVVGNPYLSIAFKTKTAEYRVGNFTYPIFFCFLFENIFLPLRK